MSLLSIVTKALNALDLDDEVNRLVIDRTVNVCRNRPHPWSTKHDYISWSGLTDRTYNARLLPAKPTTGQGIGTSRPPLQATAALFARNPPGCSRPLRNISPMASSERCCTMMMTRKIAAARHRTTRLTCRRSMVAPKRRRGRCGPAPVAA
jgi:hypothetical protein